MHCCSDREIRTNVFCSLRDANSFVNLILSESFNNLQRYYIVSIGYANHPMNLQQFRHLIILLVEN